MKGLAMGYLLVKYLSSMPSTFLKIMGGSRNFFQGGSNPTRGGQAHDFQKIIWKICKKRQFFPISGGVQTTPTPPLDPRLVICCWTQRKWQDTHTRGGHDSEYSWREYPGKKKNHAMFSEKETTRCHRYNTFHTYCARSFTSNNKNRHEYHNGAILNTLY